MLYANGEMKRGMRNQPKPRQGSAQRQTLRPANADERARGCNVGNLQTAASIPRDGTDSSRTARARARQRRTECERGEGGMPLPPIARRGLSPDAAGGGGCCCSRGRGVGEGDGGTTTVRSEGVGGWSRLSKQSTTVTSSICLFETHRPTGLIGPVSMPERLPLRARAAWILT